MVSCSLAELDKEMNQLRSGLRAVEKELEYHRTQSHVTPAGGVDRFVPAVKEFLASATYRFSELEDRFQDMKTRVCSPPNERHFSALLTSVGIFLV